MKDTKTIVVNKNNHMEWGLDITPLCKQSEHEDMTTLTVHSIETIHRVGYFIASLSEIDTRIYDVSHTLGYAAYTKDREYCGKKYAQIGGIITAPIARGNGIGEKLVHKVLQNTPLAEEFSGYAAVCNASSQQLFCRLGFECVDMVESEESHQLKPLFLIESSQLALGTVE